MKTKQILILMSILFLGFSVKSQDTTVVQTFTWDSISTRRATFDFPQELNDKRFEKVLMYYNLKCDPATPWDSYNCGEWDYLAYTRIFENTGVQDSVKVEGKSFQMNLTEPLSQDYSAFVNPFLSNSQEYFQLKRSNPTLNYNQTLSGTAAINSVFDNVNNDGVHYQFIVKASELLSAGVTPGDIESIILNGNLLAGGEYKGLTISAKFTSLTELTALSNTGFTEVYNAQKGTDASDDLPFVSGDNTFLFHQPITWNGTDNLILSIKYADYGSGTTNFTLNGVNSSENLSVIYPANNGVLKITTNNHAMSELSNIDFGDEVTVSFWAKGDGAEGTNTCVFEAYDVEGNRVLNMHMPWSNNRMYWDAGEGSGYDRIDKPIATNEIDGSWNHWALTKNATTGIMNIYKNGVLWHTGSGHTRAVGLVDRLYIGANKGLSQNWSGKIDEFQVFKKELDAATLLNWYDKKTTNSHPNYNDLLLYHTFDNVAYATDESVNDYLLMPSELGMFDFSELPNAGQQVSGLRPAISFGQGTVAGVAVSVTKYKPAAYEPHVFFEYTPINRRFAISNAFLGGVEPPVILDNNGNVSVSLPIVLDNQITNNDIFYFETPFDIINDIEIGRFITPYGIGFDLGSDGFTWVYDVTDYQQYLKNTVDLAAHNTQELIDLKFLFIEGIPPRDVHSVKEIYGKFKSYNYGNLANDVSLSEVNVPLSDSSSMFKFKSRITGHGHEGNGQCCEWSPKNHKILVDGVERYNWGIWQNTECGDNPNIGQGGTWPYAREGWCPGDLVKDKEFDLTPFVTPGTTVALDYDISDVPVSDLGQESGNYVIASQLISYGAPNFQNDAAIVDVLNPNGWEYYSKWNPTCSNPQIIIQNTGAQNLTSCKIKIWVSYGNYVEYVWTGDLAFLEKEIIEIPITNNEWWGSYSGDLTFTAQIYDVNGMGYEDDYANNNVYKTKFTAPESMNGPFHTWFKTNNRANENSYKLIDAQGNILFERTTLDNNTTYKDTFDLDPGCYSIIIEDTDNDGLSFWYSAQVEGETAGFFRVKKVSGGLQESFPGDFGSYHRYDFSIDFGVGLEELNKDVIVDLFPNPTEQNLIVSLSGTVGTDISIVLSDLSGRKLQAKDITAVNNTASTQFDVSTLPSGMYFATIQTENGTITKQFVKQ
ncbi:MAG: T9SS type A sorting domain-containing protein [Lishizhenia sp.]